MSSGDLVSSNNFAQNGTVDWVRLGDGMVSFSLKALARMANYGVDSFTILLGTKTAQQFALSRKGQARVREAINALSYHTSISKVLFFGFGISGIPQLLGTQAEGLSLLAISAALSTVYTEGVATEVLSDILLLQNPPREATPSLQSWSKIVKACAGTFATTTFPIVAEQFMRLHPSQTSTFPTGAPIDFDQTWRSRSSCQDIAEALVHLGMIARKEIESVTIEGGGDAGFLAAVAVWLFDMNIVIIDYNKETLFSNSEPGSVIHVRIIYKDRNDDTLSEPVESRELHCSSKVICLKDVSDIIFTNNDNDDMLVSGRINWEKCLSLAFGITFDRLSALQSTIGTMLGCAARVFEAIAKAEPMIDLETRQT